MRWPMLSFWMGVEQTVPVVARSMISSAMGSLAAMSLLVFGCTPASGWNGLEGRHDDGIVSMRGAASE